MTTILTTTGISLYLNTKREYNTQSPTDDQMRQYLRMEPEHASAEANSLLQIAQPDDRIVLLHTDTPKAHKCADLLQEFFEKRGFKHTQLIGLQFQEDEQHIETLGLRNLVYTLIDEVEKAQSNQQEVVINATAGFKAQIVYSTIIGMLYQFPVKYIYERFHRMITFNPVPLDWDMSLFLNYDWFFQWIEEDFRSYSEVEAKLKDLADSERIRTLLTIPDEDGHVFLLPIGVALQKKFQSEVEEAKVALWPPTSDVDSIDAKIASSILHSKHHPVTDVLSTCRKIATLPYVDGIIGGFYESPAKSRLRIRRVNMDGTIQLLWSDNNMAARLTIQTTATSGPQTLKVAEKIKEILEIK